jgi:hypothetical protein
MAGTLTAGAIARRLGRTRWSVQLRAARLELSLRVRTGYNVTDLAAVFGVHRTRARGWVTRGLLGPPEAWQGLRVSDVAVARFIRRHPHEYDLRRVDELWFKSMVFGHRAGAKIRERD